MRYTVEQRGMADITWQVWDNARNECGEREGWLATFAREEHAQMFAAVMNAGAPVNESGERNGR